MNTEKLGYKIHDWEPHEAEVIRTIDSHEDTVIRILKFEGWYYVYRYFTLQGTDEPIHVSVDLNKVDPDHVIQWLGEML